MKFRYCLIPFTLACQVLADSGALGGLSNQDNSAAPKQKSSAESSETRSLVQTSNVVNSQDSKASTQSVTDKATTTGGPITVVTGDSYTSTIWWTPSVTKWWTPSSELTASSSTLSGSDSSNSVPSSGVSVLTLTSGSSVTTITSKLSSAAKKNAKTKSSSMTATNSTNAATYPTADLILGLGAVALGALAI